MFYQEIFCVIMFSGGNLMTCLVTPPVRRDLVKMLTRKQWHRSSFLLEHCFFVNLFKVNTPVSQLPLAEDYATVYFCKCFLFRVVVLLRQYSCKKPRISKVFSRPLEQFCSYSRSEQFWQQNISYDSAKMFRSVYLILARWFGLAI